MYETLYVYFFRKKNDAAAIAIDTDPWTALSTDGPAIFRAESEQMAAILDLMQKNRDKFGNPSAEEMQSQMRLYL